MTGVPSDDSCSIVLRTVPSSSSPSAGPPTAPPPLLVAITATNLAPCRSLRACQSGQSAYRQPATSARPQSFHSSRYPIPVPTGPPSNIVALTAASSQKIERRPDRGQRKPHHQKNRAAELSIRLTNSKEICVDRKDEKRLTPGGEKSERPETTRLPGITRDDAGRSMS
ncbi:uncharacterized protein BKA78DRAFT_157939 [Phyllosticta capitalensis]|uniref:uncharacterized protein n=1 Tax=Phyllosticta capitalensis TaxID=121624 RepID=UPI00313031A0